LGSISWNNRGFGITVVRVNPTNGITATVTDSTSTPTLNISLTGTAAATSATTGTMTVPMTPQIITITPTGACTFNATGGVVGQRVTFVITTSGASSFNLTFNTNFRSIGVLATGVTTAKIFSVNFIYNGSVWIETGRTAAQ
jgi:hypothetical protein